MKKWLMLIALLSIATWAIAAQYPEPTGYVVDTTGILNQATVDKITEICKSVEPNAQIAVCIVNTTSPLDIEQYGIKLAEKWKVGFKGQDNGIILILAKGDRRVRIEVGTGMEPKINDAKAGWILDNDIVPFLKAGDWNGGMLQGVIAIKREVSK